MKKVIYSLLMLAGLFGLSLGVWAQSWTPPPNNPPSQNIEPPVTTGSVNQTKTGSLTIGGVLSAPGGLNVGAGNALQIDSGGNIQSVLSVPAGISTHNLTVLASGQGSGSYGIFVQGAIGGWAGYFQGLFGVEGNVQIKEGGISTVNDQVLPDSDSIRTGKLCLVTNGTADCVTGWDQIAGNGSSNNSQWTTNGANIYYYSSKGNGLGTGNVGIGTSNPTAKLEVQQSGTTAQLRITPGTWSASNDEPTGNAYLRFGPSTDLNHYIRAGYSTGMQFNDPDQFEFSGGGNVVVDNDLQINGGVQIKGGNPQQGAVLKSVDANGTAYWDSSFTLGQWVSGADDSIYNTNGGNVGIGTQNPTVKLEVATPNTHTASIKVAPGYFTSDTDSAYLILGDENHYIKSTWNVGMILYDINRIVFNGGNVGIGNSNPQAPLDVNGDISLSGALKQADGANNYGVYLKGGMVDGYNAGLYSVRVGELYGAAGIYAPGANDLNFGVDADKNFNFMVGSEATKVKASIDPSGNLYLRGALRSFDGNVVIQLGP